LRQILFEIPFFYNTSRYWNRLVEIEQQMHFHESGAPKMVDKTIAPLNIVLD